MDGKKWDYFNRHVKGNEIHYSKSVYSPLISVYALKSFLNVPTSFILCLVIRGRLESVYIAGRRVYTSRRFAHFFPNMSTLKFSIFTINFKKLARGEYVFNGADFP